MKFEDKIIEQITSRLTEEIHEIEEEELKAAEAAKHPAETATPETADTAADSGADDSEVSALDAEIAREQNFLDVSNLMDEVLHMTDMFGEEPEDIPAEDVLSTSEAEIPDNEQPDEENGDSGIIPSTDEAEEGANDQPSEENEAVVDEEVVEIEEPAVADEVACTEEPAENDDVTETEESTYDENEAAVDAKPAVPSKTLEILVPIIAVLAVIAIAALSVICVNLLDKSIQKNKPEIPETVPQANLASSLQSYTAGEVLTQEAVPNYTLEQIYALDLRTPSGATESDLKRVSKAGLVGLEDTFLEAEKKYGVNAIFLMSIASLESAHGTQMYRPNNMFGYGGKSYPSKEACIMDVAQGLSSRYLQPGASLYGGSPTLAGVNKRYAANPQWYAKVGKYMKSYYDVIAPYHNQYLEKIQ